MNCRKLSAALVCLVLLLELGARADESTGRLREPWNRAYTGADASGKHVMGLWTFDGAEPLKDASAGGHDLSLQGAELDEHGRFGGALRSAPGWPVADKVHAARCGSAPGLSPPDAFTIEMWICPGPELAGDYPESFLLDKKYVADTDYQLVLGAPAKDGGRVLRACLGFGTHSATWYSDPLRLETGVWTHLAFTYDGQGTGGFFVDGVARGGRYNAGCGAVAPGSRPLTIGDRNGSYYHGFPGLLDQVRLCRGVLEFRPLRVERVSDRSCFVRMEAEVSQVYRLTNLCEEPLSGASATVTIDGQSIQEQAIPAIEPGKSFDLTVALDPRLRPAKYSLAIQVQSAGPEAFETTEQMTVRIVPRPLPEQMPVVMWGGIARDLDRAKEIGFTHALGIPSDVGRIREAGKPTQALDDDRLKSARATLDEALAKGITMVAGLSPGAAMRSREEFRRIGRDGKPLKREDICGLFPEIQQLCENVGASVAKSFGDHPAFGAAMIHTEVRDHASPCFHEHDREAYRKACGEEIPAEVSSPRGVAWDKLPDFPKDRVIDDDHPILKYYRWYWKHGDGWNDLNSAVVRGLKTAGRDDFWTWHDPAVRVASVYGSGGDVDYLSQWTYSYPDPIRIGLATDELLAMARGGPKGQQVMKMTQIIWYRSQTAPETPAGKPGPGYVASWEREQPDAPFITIAPMQLREAFWTKIARPIKGIMYHGWQSLVSTDSPSGYRFTHPETQKELKRLVETIVEPLGPTLRSVPPAASDVAFLESFSSEMFARRGTYGWCGSWAGDAYHVLLYAKLQPEVVFDETIAGRGLEGFRVLVMPDCDVLTRSVVARIHQFQKAGGIVVGDERTCPAIQPDILLPVHKRTGRNDADKAALQRVASELRGQLDARYERRLNTSSPEVIPYLRRYENTDYVFLVNDHREYGNYVGHHGRVMENGLAEDTQVRLRRTGGHVYDLVQHLEVAAKVGEEGLELSIRLAPCGGVMLMACDQAIAGVRLSGPESVVPGDGATWTVEVVDESGKPLDAIVPVQVVLRDPSGRAAEFSGSYAAANGRVEVRFDVAPNDTPGQWQVEAIDLASGQKAHGTMRVEGPKPWPPRATDTEPAVNAVQPKG